MANLVGKTLGKYRLVARLGRGGMAEVYKAYQPGLDRYIGIKVLHSHLVDDQDFIGRFEREALATGKLRHPNIVQAVDFDREGDVYFMAMEFIDGPTLKDEIRARKAGGQPFSLEEIGRIFTALCSAIDYAHRRNMVHRDIKPANVMINQEGQVVLTDFGIARIMGGTQYTQTGALSGTPAYMSPEQGQGERGDERSDIYALGVMLYEMVTGMVPYEADTPFAVIMKHISEPLPLPTTVDPHIPQSVEQVILKAMAKDPDDRYQTAGEMARALRDAVGLSPDDTLQNHPLTIVAPPPKIEQIEHPTGPLTHQERTVAASDDGSEGTVWSPDSRATTIPAPARTQKSSFPLLILVGIVILVLIGVIALLLLPASSSGNTNATATAVAIAAATSDAGQAATATASIEETARAATAVILAPTETVEAATAEAEQVAATRDARATEQAEFLAGFLATAEAATAQAAAEIAIASAETATAEALAAETATTEALENATPTPLPTDTATPAPPTNTPTPVPVVPTTPPIPTNTPMPERPAISGKLAFPVDNGFIRYDVFIVSMPEGKVLATIEGARQPNFRGDGLKLLVNGQGGNFGENIFEANANGAIEKPVSGSPSDLFPVYKPDGTTLAYSNPQLAYGSQGFASYLFVQCGLKPPSQESDKCAAIADFGIIIPPGAIGDIIGSHPVWTAGDLLAYRGCNTWAGGGSCGIYVVGSWAVKRTSNGELPRKVLDGSSLTPTDSKWGYIAYQSHESGDWEAFVAREDGSGIVNLSNGPGVEDGLATISPDGRWVAFASNRSGGWAFYVVPITGGSVQKLFDFPKPNPWGSGDREWINERISWGP
jgi:serine/threonine protein kinase